MNVAPREITYVETDNSLWAAMVFLAVLAYPENNDRRDRAILAMKALMYRAARQLGKPVGGDSSELLASIPMQQQYGTIRRLTARLNKRLLAGYVAASLMLGTRKFEGYKKVPPDVQMRTRFAIMSRGISYARAESMTMKRQVIPGKLYSLNDHAKQYRGGPAKFKSEVWRPEILHLIKTFHSVALSWRDPRGFNVARLLANPGWSQHALNSAETNAVCLPRTINLPRSMAGVRSTALIRLIPVNNRTVEKSEPVTHE